GWSCIRLIVNWLSILAGLVLGPIYSFPYVPMLKVEFGINGLRHFAAGCGFWARSSQPWEPGKPKPTQPGLAFVVRVQRPSKIELTPGVFGPAQLLVGRAEKVVSREVVGVHLQSPLEELRGQPR